MRKFIAYLLLTIFSFTAIGQEFNATQTPFIQRNYIKNPGAEAGVVGLKTYADAAGLLPIDGQGGSPTVTASSSATSPITDKRSFFLTKTAANSQGQGWAIDFTIADEDKGRVLQGMFSYKINSGTFADDDISVFVLDVTNNRLIQPAPSLIKNSSITELFPFEFQSSIDSNSYRLILHIRTTSALAYVLKVDSLGISRIAKLYGSAITDWVSYTPTIGGFGSVTSLSAQSRRLGDSLEVRGSFISGTVSASAATATLGFGGINSNVTISSNIASSQLVGHAGYSTNNTVLFDGTVLASPSTGIVSFSRTTSTTSGLAAQNGNAIVASSTPVSFYFKVPIQGWSSSQVFSSDADTRVITARVDKLALQAIPNNTDTTVTFNAATLFDKSAMWDSANSRWVVKTPGDFRVTSRLAWASNASGSRFISIQKNGTSVATMYSTAHPSGDFMLGVDEIVPAIAGDLITISVFQNSGGSVNISGTGANSFSIQRVSGPSQIAASETVSALYTGAPPTGTLNTSLNITTFGTRVKDSHSAYSGGSYTIPVSGVYDIAARVYMTSSMSAGGGNYISVFIDGVERYGDLSKSAVANSGGSTKVEVKSIPLLAGQVVTIRSGTDGTGPAYFGYAPYNYFSIVRTGNY